MKDYVSIAPIYGDYLAHHGIKGQKWGKMNGPPYPLGYESHSRKEKKENRFSKNGQYIDGNKRRDNTPIEKNVPSKIDKKESKDRKDFNKNDKVNSKATFLLEKKEHDDINREILKKNPNAAVVNPDLVHKDNFFKRNKKALIIGGAVIATAAAVGVGIYLNKKHQTTINAGKNVVNDVLKNNDQKITGLAKYGYKDGEEAKRFLDSWFVCDKHRYDPIAMAEYSNLIDDSFTLPAGQNIFRMAKGHHTTLRDGIEYVSFGSDRERYKGFLPQMWKANGGHFSSVYEYTLTAEKEIKVPSKKFCIDALKDIYTESNLSPDKDPLKLALRYFNEKMTYLIDRDDEFSKKFIEKLKSAGYNAVIDYNDAGRLSDKPLIIFDAASNLSINNISEVSLKESKEIFRHIQMPEVLKDFTRKDYAEEFTNAEAMLNDILAKHYINA